MVKISQFLRLSTKFLAVLRLSVTPIETLGFSCESKRETREKRGRKNKKKKLIMPVLCRLGLRQGGLGWAIFSRVFRLSLQATKKEEAFSAGPTPSPSAHNLSGFPDSTETRPSCAHYLVTACLFRLMGTNIMDKLERWRDEARRWSFPRCFCIFRLQGL